MEEFNIVSPEITEYLRDLILNGAGLSPELTALQERAYEEGFPIITPEAAAFLRVLLTVKNPLRILEIGCAVGFSASLMAETLPNAAITTIDRFPLMIAEARKTFKTLGIEKRVTLIESDAAEILPILTDKFGFIFLDAAKGQYLNFLADCLRLLEIGGVLVCDDVLQDGILVKDRYEIPRRARSTRERMRKFLEILTNTDGLTTSVLPLGDGMSVTIKNADI
ncbi:O-methyltransferase [Clostridia bacterium]|nr:O-methyltransferase [Clostridia bacterium]